MKDKIIEVGQTTSENYKQITVKIGGEIFKGIVFKNFEKKKKW